MISNAYREYRNHCAKQWVGIIGLDSNSIFFCFLFVQNHGLAWRANPSPGKGCFLSFLPATPSSPSRTLGGAEAQRSQATVKNSWRKPWLWVCWKCTFSLRSLIVKSQPNMIELRDQTWRIHLQCRLGSTRGTARYWTGPTGGSWGHHTRGHLLMQITLTHPPSTITITDR